MLRISPNSFENNFNEDTYESLRKHKGQGNSLILKVLLVILCLAFITMFLPWTQNISTKGYITTRLPSQKPQMVQSIIDGRIERWFVKEGDYVQKGDTLLFISEIKDKYFSPKILFNLEHQIEKKSLSITSYKKKVEALSQQINALLEGKEIKKKQATNYVLQAQFEVQTDSMQFVAQKTNFHILEKQYLRTKKLYKSGLKSRTELENKKMKFQASQAKVISTENKLRAARNKLENAHLQLEGVEVEYVDKISKARSNREATLSNLYDSEANLSKMKNSYENYLVRMDMYYVKAPKTGYITKTLKSGIGETIKAGEPVLSIVSREYDIAVELYVKPVDLPLVDIGHSVSLLFDGWPSVIFSGWPNTSFGTFPGHVVAMDNNISSNGLYRILVAPDQGNMVWPKELRLGSGALGMILLKTVPVWYEVWRVVSGFPPDYYRKKSDKSMKSK